LVVQVVKIVETVQVVKIVETVEVVYGEKCGKSGKGN